MYTSECYFKEFISKKVTADIDKMDAISEDFDWDTYDEDDFPGAGHISLTLHEYEDWSVRMGLWFEIDENFCLSELKLTAHTYGDDGLGDCDPEEEYTQEDIDIAVVFLKEITS